MIKALDEIWNEIKKIENKLNELKRKESDIVYCEDCKYSYWDTDDECYYCGITTFWTDEEDCERLPNHADDWCSRGERETK